MNHPFASCCIAVPDSAPEFDFFIGRQKRHSRHLSQIVVERPVVLVLPVSHHERNRLGTILDSKLLCESWPVPAIAGLPIARIQEKRQGTRAERMRRDSQGHVLYQPVR